MSRDITLESMASELHGMCMVCLPKAVTLGRVQNTISFAFVIDYIRYCGSFEVEKAKLKYIF